MVSKPIGGGKQHVDLVKLAIKKLVDEYMDKVKSLFVEFEDSHFGFEFKIHKDQWDTTHGSFTFKPDIVARIETKKDIIFNKKDRWLDITDSNTLIFEAENDPHNIFSNTLKMEAYRMVKANDYGRQTYAFILVCWSDAKLPDILEPFDAVWRFEKPL